MSQTPAVYQGVVKCKVKIQSYSSLEYTVYCTYRELELKTFKSLCVLFISFNHPLTSFVFVFELCNTNQC